MGINATVQGNGVLLPNGAWAELANVHSPGGIGRTNLTILGGGTGSVVIGMNYLMNSTTVVFGGTANKSVSVDFLAGGNVLTVFGVGGMPWVDAVVVG